MLLILTIDGDNSTSNVIDWLLYNNTDFDRINYEELLGTEIQINSVDTKIILSNKKNYNLKNYRTYWYRRGNFQIPTKLIKGATNSECINTINTFNKDECNYVQNFIHSYLKEKTYSVNTYSDIFVNKLTLLDKAKEIGLKIPETLITTNKSNALEFIKKHESIISKPIYNGFNFTIKDANFYFHTLLINADDIKNLPVKFYVTKFQALISKSFELRIFYLEGKFYASAIFSQNDEQTKVDFRNYNEDKPNRVLPYKLPKDLQIKLTKLMNEIEMKSGSIDIIVTKSGEYVFLEVNPIGQFTQVSLPCNYYLEKEVAKIFENGKTRVN